jgi:hypothetical protein
MQTARRDLVRLPPHAQLSGGRRSAQPWRAGNDLAFVYALHRLGCVALVNDDHARAALLFKEALARYDDLGALNTAVLMTRVELAMTIAFQGDLTSAVDLCDEVRTTCEKHGERWVKAYALYVLAFAAWAQGHIEAATTLARECLRISDAFHDLVCTVLSIELLALFLAAAGQSGDAATLQGAAQQMWRAVGLPLFGSVYFNAPQRVRNSGAEGARRRHLRNGLPPGR